MSGPTEQILVTAVHLTSDGFLQVWGNSALKERSEYSIPSNREAILEGTSPSLNAISPDKIYLSLDPEDGYWYRCRVLELVDRTHMNYARLLFIDTGGQTTKSYADLIVTDDENLLGAAKCFQLKGIKPPQSNELWCEIAMDALGTLLHHTVLIEDITVRRSEGPRNIDLYVGECQDVLRTLFTYKVAKYAPTNGERKPENVRIWHIESPLSFWVVPVSSEGDARLLEYIINHEHYTSKIKPLHKKSIRRGVLCLVYSKHISPYYQFDKQSFANRDDDRILARGHILYVEKQVDEGCVVVQLVDYGRRERIPFTQIYEITQISDIVKVHPPMVKKYALHGLKSRVRCAKMACPFAQKIVKQAKADFYDFAHYAAEGDEVAERRIFESVPSTEDPTRTDLFFDGNNLCEELISEYMWNVHDCGYSTASSDESEKMETVQVSPGVLYDVKIENVDEYSENGNGVYAILTEFEEQLSSLNEKLTQANLEAMRDEDITAGRACVALWEKDQRKYAYRAEILGVYSERTVVQLLDSGTRIIISRLDPSENLFYLPPEFKQLPKQAIRCTLLRKMSGDYRSHDGGITRELMEIQQDERVVGMEVLKLPCCSNQPHTINILNNGNPMIELPTKKTIVCLRLGEQQICLKEVCRQTGSVLLKGIPLSKQNEFEDIHETLNTKLGATNNVIQEFFVGDYVAAKMGKRWCRAVVEEVYPFRDLNYEFSCKYEVRYLDLGSREILLDEFVAELPREVMNIPPLFVSVQIPICDRSSNVEALVGKYITLNIIAVKQCAQNLIYEGTCDFDKYCEYQISPEIFNKYQEIKTQERNVDELSRNEQMLKVKIENHTIDDKFFVYLEDEVEEFQLFKSQLSEACESAPSVTSLSGNAHNFIVGANIPFFGWVRCRVVEKITSQNAEVELLDHSDQLRRINVDQMVKLEDRFVEMRKRTISCKLLNPDLRVERLRVVARLSEGEFTAKFIDEIEEGVFSVEIYSEGKLLNDTMRMEMDFTGRKSVYASEPILVGALLDVQVIRAQCARTFAIRKKTKEHYRLRDTFHDEFEAYKARALDMPTLREFNVGDAVATMTPDGYMRGEVERVLDDGHQIQVHCVDTALSLIQAEHLVHHLPKPFVIKFPAQAIYCSTYGFYDEAKEDFVDHILKQFVVKHGTNNLSAKVIATAVMNGKKILIVDLFSLSESLIGSFRSFGAGHEAPIYPMFEDPIFTFTSWIASETLKKGEEIVVTMCSVSEVYGEKVVNIMCNNDRSALDDALANCVENAEEAPENPHHIGVVITRNGPCRVQTASKKALFCVDDGFTIKSGGTMIIPSAELLKIPAQSSAVTLCDTDHFNEYEWAKLRRFCTERNRVIAKVEGQKNGLPVLRIDLKKYGFHLKPVSQDTDLIGMPFWHTCQPRADLKKILQPHWSSAPNEAIVNDCILLYVDSRQAQVHIRHKHTEEVYLALQDHMEETYFAARNNDYKPPSIEKGDVVAAKLHSSQIWYRGRILEKMSHDVFNVAYKVMLLDAGGIVYIPGCSIKVLPTNLRRTPQLAITFDFGDDFTMFNTAQVEQIKAMFAAKDCTIKIRDNLYTLDVSSSLFQLPLYELLLALDTTEYNTSRSSFSTLSSD